MLTRLILLLAVLGASIGTGYWMQREVPSEKNRVRHPMGYSVCHPQDWSVEVRFADASAVPNHNEAADSLWLSPDHFDGIPPKLAVNRILGAPDMQQMAANGWAEGSFQGQPAQVLDTRTAHGMIRGALFERAGQWFEVEERLSVAASAQKERWWQFLQTFRYPDGAIPATSQPSASVIALPATGPSPAPFSFPSVGQ